MNSSKHKASHSSLRKLCNEKRAVNCSACSYHGVHRTERYTDGHMTITQLATWKPSTLASSSQQNFRVTNAPSEKQRCCFLPVLPIQPSRSAASSLRPVVHFHFVPPAAGSPVQKQQALLHRGPRTNSPKLICRAALLLLLTDGAGCWWDAAWGVEGNSVQHCSSRYQPCARCSVKFLFPFTQPQNPEWDISLSTSQFQCHIIYILLSRTQPPPTTIHQVSLSVHDQSLLDKFQLRKKNYLEEWC